MKKLLILLAALLVSLILIGRPKVDFKVVDEAIANLILGEFKNMGYNVLPEVVIQDTLKRKPPQDKSNYEKYWEEKEMKAGRGHQEQPIVQNPKEFDDLYYIPPKDTAKKYNKKIKKQPVQIVENNYYYDDNPFIYGRFFRPFYFSWNFYTPYYYGWYDPFYYDWYYPYYVWGFPYYSWNFWWGYPAHYGYNNYNHYNNNYYGNNNHNYNNNISPQYSRRERPSNMTQNNPSRRPVQQQIKQPQRTNPQTMKQYSDGRRQYTPTYDNPRMSTRPQFNNSKASNTENTNTNTGNMNRNMGNTNNIQNRRSEMNNQIRTYTQPQRNIETRTYSAPPSRSYSEPSRMNNSSNDFSRRSGESNYNSIGGAGRSSGGSTSGASNNSGGTTPTRR